MFPQLRHRSLYAAVDRFPSPKGAGIHINRVARTLVQVFAGHTQWQYYPAAPLFPSADRILTACGFNVMRQAAPYRRTHRYIPFVRRFDDQSLRTARTRS